MRSNKSGGGSGVESSPDPESAADRPKSPDAETTPDEADNAESEPAATRPALRLPLLSGGAEIGLGDVIKRATTVLGGRPCPGCERRAQYLNRVRFTSRKRGW